MPRVLCYPEAVEVSASSLVTPENSSDPIIAPAPKKKLFAEDLPETLRAQLKPTYPGSPLARHPITKQFVSLKPKPKEPSFSDATPEPLRPGMDSAERASSSDSEKPLKPVETAVGNGTTEPPPAADTTAPPPTDAPPQPDAGPAPDFSDLPHDGQPGEQAPPPRDPAQEANAHRTVVGFVWDGFINLMVFIFGAEWFPATAQERNTVVEAWVQALLWMGTRILNPLQLAYAATATYCFSRLLTILRWWRNRQTKKARVEEDQTQGEQEPERQRSGQPHNFSGVNVTKEGGAE